MDEERGRKLDVKILRDKQEIGVAAARHAAESLRRNLAKHGVARLICATGVSQFGLLEELTSAPGIDWERVELFHLDEYVGLAITNAASFRKYLLERMIRKTGITRHHLLDGERKPGEVIREVGAELKPEPVNLAFVGIGENGHLAFNDPPADFETEEPYLVVELDAAVRRQQVNDGWFSSLAEGPISAVSLP